MPVQGVFSTCLTLIHKVLNRKAFYVIDFYILLYLSLSLSKNFSGRERAVIPS